MNTGSGDERRFLSNIEGIRRALERIADAMESEPEQAEAPLVAIEPGLAYLVESGDPETAKPLAGSTLACRVQLDGPSGAVVSPRTLRWSETTDAAAIVVQIGKDRIVWFPVPEHLDGGILELPAPEWSLK